MRACNKREYRMDNVVFLDHAATSREAAKPLSRSAVTPASRARRVPSTADHQLAGIKFLCDHFRTDSCEAPTSSASASCVGHKPMIDRNDRGLAMLAVMGPSVPNVKADVSRDSLSRSGHAVLMDEDRAERQWRQDFKQRLKQARGPRTQEDMAELLCVSRDAYSKYEGGRDTDLPIRLLPRFCKICGVSMAWLITGEETSPASRSRRSA